MTSLPAIRVILETSYQNCWNQNEWNLHIAWQDCAGAGWADDISKWPVDATKIFEDDQHVLILGSLKSACEIEQVNANLNVNINIVVTMNAGDKDPKRHGERDCYKTYYDELDIVNLRYDGRDLVSSQRNEYETQKAEYKARWGMVCRDIVHLEAVNPRGKTTILFHCFGGLNRSSSALCAFLILQKKNSVETAARTLVEHRAGQQYWKERDYFIEGLLELKSL